MKKQAGKLSGLLFHLKKSVGRNTGLTNIPLSEFYKGLVTIWEMCEIRYIA